MIIKKIPNPKKSASKASRATGLTNYIREPQTENGLEKCIHTEANNFFTDTEFGQTSEMIALASEAVKSKDPIDHWIFSWKENEHPTIEQAREAVDIFIKHCGLAGHQYIWGLHHDTENMHVHIAVNRVHPDTLQVVKINKGFDLNAGHQAIALIEHKQGWSKENDARFDIVNNKPVLRKQNTDKQLQPDAHAQAMEVHTGAKSEQRIGIEQAAPIIQQSKSWKELHATLAAVGMEYRREGSGAKVYVDENAVGVKASDVHRSASFGSLQKRLGPYQPATEINKNDYHDTSRIFNETKIKNASTIGKNTGHGLRSLSKCTVAHSKEGKQGFSKSVLQLDARANRRASSGLRRSAGRSAGRTAEPVNTNQHGWDEYQVIRAELKSIKTLKVIDLRTAHNAQRAALFAKQKAERDELFKSRDWRGKGDLRNAMQSVIATRNAAEKLELQEQQRVERAALHEQYKLLPSYKIWQEQPQIVTLKPLTPS